MTCRGICERHRDEKIDTSTILKDVHRVICICYMTEQSVLVVAHNYVLNENQNLEIYSKTRYLKKLYSERDSRSCS